MTDATGTQTEVEAAPPDSGVEIELRNVVKRFPGSSQAAVDDLTMTIPAGEIVVLLGPSGSGKTTTIRLINRLIEPTSGVIRIGGQDALAQHPDQLRRKIGYVIQDAGLFPHMTVGTNVGLVPQMLGWDRSRISARVDELLELVGLPPREFRGRYPRQLSGGQQQRVGVARALAADPPVMLMDEPFGALDPITREMLQDELLRIQDEVRKTVVFVTHDVDEALRIGDRIAVLGKGSTLVQYAPPRDLLVNPANDYVEQFLGGGSGMRLLKLSRVAEVPLGEVVEAGTDDDVTTVRERIEAADTSYALVLDGERRPLRWVTLDLLDGAEGALGDRGSAMPTTVSADSTLQEALDTLVQAEHDLVPVVSRDGVYRGIVTLGTLQDAVRDIKTRERVGKPAAR